ncbi:neprilysin-1-like [Ornithodoros turicata]|uniref:neprilysin-1-like n=1 Tax=Ornithodoros turicata TaxID=34597 RepID=UPI003139487E
MSRERNSDRKSTAGVLDAAFSEITYESLGTLASEATLRRSAARREPSPVSSAESPYGGWSRFSVSRGNANQRSAAGHSIFTGRLSFQRSHQWGLTTAADRKLRERRLALWRYGSGDVANTTEPTFRTSRSPRPLVCLCLASLAAALAVAVLAVSVRLRSIRNRDPLDVVGIVSPLPCAQYDFCRHEASHLLFNASVSPCQDFHAFACGPWSATSEHRSQHEEATNHVMRTLLKRSLAEMSRGGDNRSGEFEFDLANDILFEKCMRTNSRERSSLGIARKLLAEFGLGGWPYGEGKLQDGEELVLRTAAKIALQLGLSALMSVRSPTPGREFEVDEPVLLLRREDLSGPDVTTRTTLLHQQLVAESFFYFAHSSRNVYKIQEQIQLVSLVLARGSRRATERRFCSFNHERASLSNTSVIARYVRYLQPLGFAVHSNSSVVVRNPVQLRALDFLFRYFRPRHLLNYLGFRFLIHMSPLIFEIPNNMVRARMYQATGIDKMVWLRAEVCLRLTEEALPLFYLYDYYSSQPESYWKGIEAVLSVIQRSVLTRAVMPWRFSEADKEKVLVILTGLDFRSFLPSWLLNETRLEAYNRRLLPSRNADVFQMFMDVWRKRTRAAFAPRRRVDQLLADPNWVGSVFDGMPTYSTRENLLYIPMALFNTSIPATLEAFYLHSVATTWKLVYALAPVFELSTFWDDDTLSSFQSYQQCARKRYDPYMQRSLRDSALYLAFADEISVFWSERLVKVFEGTSAASPLDPRYDRAHMFYLYTALSKCRSYGVTPQPLAAVADKYRINVPYMYSAKFRKTWRCSARFACK